MAGEINKLELEQFDQLLDAIIADAETNKNNKKTEKTFVHASSVTQPELIGGKIGDMMVAKVNSDGVTLVVYTSAAECSRACNINPTTVRQRASKEYIDEKGLKWSYITAEDYNNLIK
jgi:hypothetical protein